EPKLPQCRVDLARAGDVPLRGQRPGLVRRHIGLGRVTQPAQEDVVEVLLHLGLVQLLQDPLFQVFRPFPEGGMGLLAAVGVDLLVARDLLNQVGQEERGARKWLAPSTLYRPQAVRGMPEVPIAPPATARRLSALSPSL